MVYKIWNPSRLFYCDPVGSYPDLSFLHEKGRVYPLFNGICDYGGGNAHYLCLSGHLWLRLSRNRGNYYCIPFRASSGRHSRQAMVCQNRPQNNSFGNCHFVPAVYLLFMGFIFQERASSAILPLILLSLFIFMRVPVSCCCRNYRGGKKSCGRLPCRRSLRRCRGHIGYRNDFDPPVGN